MSWLDHLKLIRFFDFYLAVVLLLGTAARVRQYRAVLGVVRGVPSRWPRLFALVRQHGSLFLTWGTVLPLALVLGLFLVNTLLRRLVLADADLTPRQLLDAWPAAVVVGVSGTAMLAFDAWGAWDVAEIDRAELEKYFDQAEYWLRPWTAPVVRFFTLGYVNPRQLVAAEVRTALVNASQLINSTLWWTSIQTGLRLAYALSLWLSYAWTRHAG
jgi:hypothetical protein